MAIDIQDTTYYTLQEIAQALYVTPQTVRTYIKQERLKGLRIGRPILITESNLGEFLQNDKYAV
jgi:excisionase family DNA binding protein